MGRFCLYIYLVLLALSCQKGGDGGQRPSGRLNLVVEMPQFTRSESRFLENYMTSSYSVVVKRLLDGEVAYSGTLGELPPQMALNAGIYTITVESDKLEKASYISLYCFGEQKVTILDNEIQTLHMSLDVVSTAILLECSDAFKSQYASYRVVVSCEGDSLIFDSEGEHTVGYFPMGDKSLEVDISGYNSSSDGWDSRSYTIHNSGSREFHDLMLDLGDSGEVVMHRATSGENK